MVNLMEQNIPNQGRVSYIPQKLIRNRSIGVIDEANAVMNAGMNEGIILRNPDSVYSGVRSDNLLKVQGIISGIFTVGGWVFPECSHRISGVYVGREDGGWSQQNLSCLRIKRGRETRYLG
jgi:ATP-dependent DNA ligase